MSLWRFLQAICLVGSACVVLMQGYEDDIEVKYGTYYNEIIERDQQEVDTAATTPEPCKSVELSKWDKLFTMLENSQMKDNMLLQYADETIKVGLQALHGEMLQFEVLQFEVQYGGSCTGAVENAARNVGMHLEQLHRAGREQRVLHNATLQQLLVGSRGQAARLAKVEGACLTAMLQSKPGLSAEAKGFLSRHLMQEVMPEAEGLGAGQLERMLGSLSSELQTLQAQMDLYLRSTAGRMLPAGCDTALLFPMRSRGIHAMVQPRDLLAARALTVCLWVRPLEVLNATVLVSYGTLRNPYELQLLLSGRSALLTVGGEAHLVEASGAVEEGRWTHLCGAWRSEQGLASLWVAGRWAASSPGVAEGHQLLGGGVMRLGQEAGHQQHPERAFTGRMTGVNVWDRVLSEGEIAQQAAQDRQGCGSRGNVVGWGVTPIVPRDGAQLVY